MRPYLKAAQPGHEALLLIALVGPQRDPLPALDPFEQLQRRMPLGRVARLRDHASAGFPPTVLGYYLLVLLSRNSGLGHIYESLFGQPLVFTWQAAVVAAILHSAPIYIKGARNVLEAVDYRFEWVAQSLGASEWRTFSQITLPLAWRGLSSLASLCFARSLGDFGITMMVAGNIPGRTQTLSVAIFDAVESGNGHMARVLVLIMSATALVLLWAASYFSRPTARASHNG